MTAHDYDLLVVGSGPAGHRAAIQAAKLGKRTAVVEHQADGCRERLIQGGGRRLCADYRRRIWGMEER